LTVPTEPVETELSWLRAGWGDSTPALMPAF
jgi:hypothetical protein